MSSNKRLREKQLAKRVRICYLNRYIVVFTVACIVSLYALFWRSFHLWRKYKRAKVNPLGDASEPPTAAAVAEELIQNSLAAAAQSTAGLDSVTTAVEAFKVELMDGVAIEAADRDRHDLESKEEEYRHKVEESRLTVLVLCFEDLTFTCINLWMMGSNPSEISAVLLFSFAFNCTMLGLKMPEVKELARHAALKVRARLALGKKKNQASELKAAREERRRSSMGGQPLAGSKNTSNLVSRVEYDTALKSALARLAEKDAEIAELKAKME